MAYTRTWNNAYEAIPDGDDLRITVDDRIRELKADIRERMETVFHWSIQDPITVRPEFSGIMDGKVLMLHAGDCVATTNTFDGNIITSNNANAGLRYNVTTGGVVTLFSGLFLPVSAVITNISGLFNNDVGGAGRVVDIYLNSKDYSASTNMQSGLMTAQATLGAGEIRTVTQSGGVVLAADKIYYLLVTMTTGSGSSPTFYGFKITYNVPTAEALR